MSLSLSSLLNPTADPETQAAPPPPIPQRRESLPPIQYVQSPEQQYAQSSHNVHPTQRRYSYAPSATTEQEAVQALASLSGNTPPSAQRQWSGSNAPPTLIYDSRSYSLDQRRGSSSYYDAAQLPPPPTPASATGRNPSSPTLDAYHVASRSPEQRRASLISPVQPEYTLPPMQNFVSPSPVEQVPRPLPAYQPPPALLSPEARQRSIATTEHVNERMQTSQTANASAMSPTDYFHDSAMPPTTMQQASPPPNNIKTEQAGAPHTPSPQVSGKLNGKTSDSHDLKTIASLKNEHGLRTHSPLRESSVPMQSTESSAPQSSNPKKRPAPSKTKKGTATPKKGPAAKKRKLDAGRSLTPASRGSRPLALKTGSSVGTPAQSSPAPSTRAQSADANDEPYNDYDEDEGGVDTDDIEADEDDGDDGDEDTDLYCICRKPDNGTFMIGCDGTCDDWFHGKCVGIEERDKNLIDKYVCPSCTKHGVGKTTWKRICRRAGCRMPARVGKTKAGKEGSKYCSDECGMLFMREMLSKTRGREDWSQRAKGIRRKGSFAGNERGSIDYDLGARGGTLAVGELKSLIDSSTSAEDFKKLGEGVLSPPATPDGNKPYAASEHDPVKTEMMYTDSEAQAIDRISAEKERSRQRHQLLKDRMKFVTMAKQAATRTATEKELKPKDWCGYDSRLEWAGAEFARWRDSPTGQAAFDSETLPMPDATGVTTSHNAADAEMHEAVDALPNIEICDRKKCARHLEWAKLAVDDVRFEMSDNGDRMRALEREQRDLKEKAGLRAKTAATS